MKLHQECCGNSVTMIDRVFCAIYETNVQQKIKIIIIVKCSIDEMFNTYFFQMHCEMLKNQSLL